MQRIKSNYKIQKGLIKFADGNTINIEDISLNFIDSTIKYVHKVNSDSIDFNFFDKKHIEKIQLNIKNLNIELRNCEVVGIADEDVNITQIITLEFEELKIKKAYTSAQRKHRIKACISNVLFENVYLRMSLNKKEEFKINNIKIKYIPSRKDKAYLVFDNYNTQASENEILSIIENINDLFLLYFGRYFKIEYISIKSKNYKEYLRHTSLHPLCINPVHKCEFIDYRRIHFKEFLLIVYDKYALNKNIWNMDLLISYFILVYHTGFKDLKFLYLSIFFEKLKSSYARNIKLYKKIGKNFFNGTKKLSFKNILIDFSIYSSINLDTSFIKYRNDVIHDSDYRIPMEICFKLENQTKKVLAYLIGLDDEYILYRKNI